MIIGRCNSSENSRNRYDETFCIFSFMQDADGIWRVHLKFCCKIILMIVFLISFFWFFYAIYTYINQGQHVGLYVFAGVFFAAIGIMGIISCYTRYFEIDPNNKIIVYGAYNKKYSKNKYLIKFSSVSYITIKKEKFLPIQLRHYRHIPSCWLINLETTNLYYRGIIKTLQWLRIQ